MVEFKRAFDACFGEAHTSFNVHLFTHCLEAHAHFGPLCSISAYAAENAYGEMTRCYKAGTRNLCKQALVNSYVKAYSKKHNCCPQIRVNDAKSARTCDSFVYTAGYVMYRVMEFPSPGSVDAMAVKPVSGLPFDYVLQNGYELHFHDIGIFGGIEESAAETEIIPYTEVEGKVIIGNDNTYAVCVPKQMLLERSF